MAACSSIFAVLDEQVETNTGTKRLTKVQGAVRFDEVSFSYPGTQSNVLQNISFTAEPGQTIALVGRSGSGKSTLSHLLTRFYAPQSGTITLDNINLADIELTELRKQFALVSQHVTLFNDSIANNISYGCTENVFRADVERVAKLAHVMEFVNDMPQGLDTIVGEDGFMLSGGQRQRIAIARALLRQAPILILDEATSALDTESERYIQDALDTLQAQCTSFVVAHRLSTIEAADMILVLEDGQIVERGQHSELLQQAGFYANLYNMQFSEQE